MQDYFLVHTHPRTGIPYRMQTHMRAVWQDTFGVPCCRIGRLLMSHCHTTSAAPLVAWLQAHDEAILSRAIVIPCPGDRHMRASLGYNEPSKA